MTDAQLKTLERVLQDWKAPHNSGYAEEAEALRAALNDLRPRRFPETYTGVAESISHAIALKADAAMTLTAAMRTLAILETAHDRERSVSGGER